MTQSDTGAADLENQSVRSRIALEDAEVALAVLLCLDAGIRVRLANPLPAAPELPDPEDSLGRARVGHDGCRETLLAFHRPRLDRRIAEGTGRRDIAVEVKARSASDGRPPGWPLGDLAGRLDSRGEHSVLLSLNVPFGAARERKDRRPRPAADALARARQHVPTEETRFRLGPTSTSRVGRVRSELTAAETRDVGPKIDYLNARPELERTEGLVLWTWNPGVDDGAAAVPVASEIRLEERQT